MRTQRRETKARQVIGLVFILSLLSGCLLWAQYTEELTLGRRTLYSVPRTSLALTEAVPLRIGLSSARYLAAVGGVTFESTGIPAAKNSPQFELTYEPSNPDGRRLWVTWNGTRALAPIYDWQFIPTAKFADSDYTACFSLFTPEETVNADPKLRQFLEEKPEGRIVRFHPAFKNTLVGLRLMQLDMLILSEDSVELPKMRTGHYVLGNGESRPSVDTAKRALDRVRSVVQEPDTTGQTPFDSYVINDQDARPRISFGREPKVADSEILILSGTPAFFTFRRGADEATIIPTRPLSRWLNTNLPTIREINPAVWDTGVNVLRYAAFFRYCRKNNPESWNRFVATIQAVVPEPTVSTPDLIDDPEAAQATKSLEELLQLYRRGASQPDARRH